MAEMMIGKKMRVYVQMDDKLLDISGDVRSFSLDYNLVETTARGDALPTFIPGIPDFQIRMSGLASWSLVDDFVAPAKSKTEWKCDFCGHINPIKARYCGHKEKHAIGCGARRSFVVDMQND